MKIFPFKLIDLTHTLDDNIPGWEDGASFEHHIYHDYVQSNTRTAFRLHTMVFHKAGVGTHIDSPRHCFAEGKPIDELLVQDLVAPCVVIDVSHVADENYYVSIEDIEAFELSHQKISPGSVVMIRTGWERFWTEPLKYRNGYQFPAIAKETAEFLLTRQIAGVGIDTLSPDKPMDDHPVHAIILGAGKYILENVAHLEKMPSVGSYILSLPLKLKGGTEAPVRLVGLIP